MEKGCNNCKNKGESYYIYPCSDCRDGDLWEDGTHLITRIDKLEARVKWLEQQLIGDPDYD